MHINTGANVQKEEEETTRNRPKERMNALRDYFHERSKVRALRASRRRIKTEAARVSLWWASFDYLTATTTVEGATKLGRDCICSKNNPFPSCVSLPCLLFVSYALRTVCLRNTLLACYDFVFSFSFVCAPPAQRG